MSQQGYPQPGYPQPGYPQPGYPQPGYPQPGYPQAGYPQPGYPQPGYPQPGFPQGGYPAGAGYPPGAGPSQGGFPPPPPHQEAPQSADFGWKPYPSPNASNTSGRTPFIDPEDLEAKNFAFSDQSIRKGFIRKVYLILMGQLLFTFGVVALFVFCQPVQTFSERNPGLLIAACITTLVIVIAMACCENARRSFPTNFICLGIFTMAESFLVGFISSRYKTESILIAVGITAILCLTLSIFAMQTKYDFTACGGFLLIALVCLMIFGIVGIFWRNHLLHTIYAGCGALLACIFLIYDTQMMMGGDHKYSISPEEYIFAALNLYMDVIRIFLYILQLLGEKK